MESYDEEIMRNPFFKCLHDKFSSFYKNAANNRWMILIPRSGCVSEKHSYSQDDFKTHILIPDNNTFHTLNEKEVIIQGNVIKTGKGFSSLNIVSILFEETFFNENEESFRVICIDSPLEGFFEEHEHETVQNFSEVALNTLDDCMSLLWSRRGNQRLQRHLDEMIVHFNENYHTLEMASLRQHIDEVHNLCLKAFQLVIKDPYLKKITQEKKYLHHNIFLATETYVLHGLYKKIFKGISAIEAHEDAELNKKTRNLSELQLRDLGVKEEFFDCIPRAKKELRYLNRYSTPLGKITCLKKVINAITKQVHNTEGDSGELVVTTDDLLPILVFLIIKSDVPNWLANLSYMRNFRFTRSATDEYGYYIASVEAAVDYIKQELFISNLINPLQSISVNLLSPKLTSSSWMNLEESNNSVQLFFQCIRDNQIGDVEQCLAKSKNLLDNVNLKLCHPLCSCDSCEKIIARSRADSSVTVFSRDDRGFTGLHAASFYGHCNLVEVLIQHNADINATDYHGSTPLHIAAQKGHQRITLLLIDSGANVNLADNDGNTPLHVATANGHEDCVKALVYYFVSQNGTDVNAANDFGDTPLHFAATWGYEGIIQTLLENGASAETKNKRKLTPVDCAHNVHISKMMIKAVQEASEKEVGFVQLMPETPPTVVNGIVVKEMPVQYIKEEQESSSNYSYKNAYRQVERLLKAIADGDEKLAYYYLGWENSSDDEDDVSNTELCHPLCICEKCQPVQQKSASLPSADMVHVNSCNAEDVTPLHMASVHGNEILVQRFLKRGANVNSKTKSQGCTPLHLACQHNRAQIVHILVEHGARVTTKDNRGNTPLHYCCISGCSSPARILLQYGASVNVGNFKGNTPLHEAARWNYLSLIDLLLSHGAIINSRNKAHLTPLQLAQSDDILQILDNGETGSDSVETDSDIFPIDFSSSLKSSFSSQDSPLNNKSQNLP